METRQHNFDGSDFFLRIRIRIRIRTKGDIALFVKLVFLGFFSLFFCLYFTVTLKTTRSQSSTTETDNDSSVNGG